MLAFLFALAITIPHTDATVGYAAIDLKSGRRISSNGNERFPMASVFKFPVALVALQRVDAGELKLDDAITIQPSQFSRGHSPLRDSAMGKPVSVTIRRLIELMVSESDNTAVDYFIRRFGGAAITSRIRALGGAGVRIDRPENDIAEAIQKHGIPAYIRDPRDTATPDGMASLLSAFARHKDGLSPASHDLLLQFMTNSHNPVRIGSSLPTGAVVTHKTGTMPGVFNDVGIITSADGKHHIAIAIFTKKASEQDEKLALRVVGQIAREVFDAFAPQQQMSIEQELHSSTPNMAAISVSNMRSKSSGTSISPFKKPSRFGFFGESRAETFTSGLPAFAMMKDSPFAARSTTFDSWVSSWANFRHSLSATAGSPPPAGPARFFPSERMPPPSTVTRAGRRRRFPLM